MCLFLVQVALNVNKGSAAVDSRLILKVKLQYDPEFQQKFCTSGMGVRRAKAAFSSG
jgi:hypothetical protein